jgi:hypothetical protein
MSLVARMTPYWRTVSASSRAKPCYPDGRSNPGKREGKSTFRFKPSRISSIRQYLVTRMVIHSREANHCPIGTGPVTHGRYAMYSRAIPGSRGWPREGRLQNLPAHRPCSLKTAARLAAPSSRAVFLESKFPNPAPATVCALGKASLTFVRLTFTPLRRFIKIGQGNFQSFGHPH